MMRRMILCLACAAASPFVCVVITGFNAVDTCVETKILRRVRIVASSSTPSTRRLLDGVAMPVPRRSTEPGRPPHRREMTL